MGSKMTHRILEETMSHYFQFMGCQNKAYFNEEGGRRHFPKAYSLLVIFGYSLTRLLAGTKTNDYPTLGSMEVPYEYCGSNGKPEKKDTYRICKQMEEKMTAKAECDFEYIFLRDYNIIECKGCDQCFIRGDEHCPNKDDVEKIKEKLMAADGIIFAAPVYAHHIPGYLKTLCDRLAYLFHRQVLVGKPAITITTTAGDCIKPVENYLKMLAVGWGCSWQGRLSLVSPQYFPNDNYGPEKYSQKYHDAKESELLKLAEKLLGAIETEAMPVPTYYDILMF